MLKIMDGVFVITTTVSARFLTTSPENVAITPQRSISNQKEISHGRGSVASMLDAQQPICSIGNMARLILNCEGVGLVMRELGRDIVMIGRSPLNQIVIDHPTISAHHAVLLRTGASYSLKDLNSTNGTQINGDFVTVAELKDGDTIRFGSVTAVFAGAYRKPCSSHVIRKFWMSISGKGAQPVAFAMASASLNLV